MLGEPIARQDIQVFLNDERANEHQEFTVQHQVHDHAGRSRLFNTDRIDHLHVGETPSPDFHLHYGDLSDAGALRNVLDDVQPDEVYNLGAQSHVRVSFDQPEYTVDVVGVAVIRLLEAIRNYMKHSGKKVRFYQAGSSEMFGSAKPRQHEGTRFEPRSPYACAAQEKLQIAMKMIAPGARGLPGVPSRQSLPGTRRGPACGASSCVSDSGSGDGCRVELEPQSPHHFDEGFQLWIALAR